MTILDTNVLSELARARPARKVLDWLGSQRATALYTTSITQAEMLYGLLLLPAGRRRDGLESALAALFAEFQGRILPFGTEATGAYAEIAAERRDAGRPISHFDAQIAAIARSNGAALATRNVADFQACGITVVDPWA